MTTISGTIKDAAGNACEGVRITVALESGFTPGFVPSLDYDIGAPAYVVTDSDGDWSIDLIPNSLVVFPEGTVYKIIEDPKLPFAKAYYIQVPDVGESYRVEDILASTP